MDSKHIEYLENLPLLNGLPQDVIVELAGQLDTRTLSEGETLFHQGDPGNNALYIIKEGQVKVVTHTMDGEELILNQFGPGEFFGEMSLIDQEPRSAGAIALSPVVMLRLGRDDFQTVLTKHPLVILEITRGLSYKLRFGLHSKSC